MGGGLTKALTQKGGEPLKMGYKERKEVKVYILTRTLSDGRVEEYEFTGTFDEAWKRQEKDNPEEESNG